MATFALVDCNNFYASCERLFQPRLRGRPVVVLSNNDGCVIARSNEAKALGVAMGAPLFKIRKLIEEHDIAVCSSNYALYGDISERVMSILGSNAPGHEIYSIDECFLDLDRLAVADLTEWCRDLRQTTLKWTGIPVSVGVGPTKTLAKLANRLAKKSAKAGGVLDLVHHPNWIEAALRKTPIGDVWGVGRRWSAMLEERGIRFLAYANPYLAVDGILYEEARSGGHFCLRQDSDEVYLVDFGEFDCGVLDFTREETRAWFAEKVLGREMLDIGISGWMADFGEYLPTDVRLADGNDPMEAHNRWPVLWAEVNARAVASRGKTGDAVFFMRAGFSGVQAHCPLLWAGDQSVDFSRHDGIGTVITAALSAGLVGNAYSHSDCGGYTSLYGNVRTVELMQRWCELAAFAPVMRSHEGNRPDDNLQYDSSEDLLDCFARWSRVHAHLAPYVRHLCDEAQELGLPAQRPLFLHYPADPALFAVQDQYLYGADLLVAPVIEEGAVARRVILPGEGPWQHSWTGELYAPGTHDIPAPIGRPPVFHRPGSAFAALFEGLAGVLEQ